MTSLWGNVQKLKALSKAIDEDFEEFWKPRFRAAKDRKEFDGILAALKIEIGGGEMPTIIHVALCLELDNFRFRTGVYDAKKV